MERKPVESGNVASVGHDPVNHVLEVEFRHGGVYRYRGIPQELVDGLMESESKGAYLHAHLKPFGSERVQEG